MPDAGSLDALRALNADRAANRDGILAFLAVDRPLPDDHATAIEVAHMAVAAAGYTDPTPPEADRRRYLHTAVAAAEKALALAPDSAESHYWFAVNRALELDTLGPFAKLTGVGPVRRSAERAVALDERVNSGGPLRIRAMLRFKLPFFLGGSHKGALADLERAASLFPEWRENALFLAQVQEVVVGPDAAIATLRRGLAAPRQTDPEEESRWERVMSADLVRLGG